MKRLIAFLAVVAAGAGAEAAADPALTVLERKVDLLQSQLDLAKTQLDIHLVQRELLVPAVNAMQAGLNDARRREWEGVLLRCATSPGRCVAPPLHSTNILDPECEELDEEPDSPELFHYFCPLKDIYVTVLRDLEAVERQGLARDTAAARAQLDAAAAAVAAQDAEAAFWSLCAAFKALACR